jgi:hypothetical protein
MFSTQIVYNCNSDEGEGDGQVRMRRRSSSSLSLDVKETPFAVGPGMFVNPPLRKDFTLQT